MTETLIKIGKGKSNKNAAQTLAGINFDKVLQSLSNETLKGSEDALVLLKVICQGLLENKKYEGIVEVTKCIFNLMNSDDVIERVSSDLIGLLLTEIDALPMKELVSLVDIFLEAIKTGSITNAKSLELFPKVLSTLSSIANVKLSGENAGEMTGAEYKSHVLNTLCSCRWSGEIVLIMTTMLRDIQMNEEELGFVVKKVTRMLKEIVLVEVPPLVYQLLLLSTKGQKSDVIDGVVSYFVDKASEYEQENNPLLQEEVDNSLLLSIEGTVILHITFSMKQDHELGKELVKYIKAGVQSKPERVLSPFCIALALAASQIHRLEEQVLEFLKTVVINSLKDSDRRKCSKWVKDLFPGQCDIGDSILQAARNSKHGWDHVTQGLIQLAFTLLAVYTPKQHEHFSLHGDAKTPQQKACKLGATLIEETFLHQEIVREEVLQRLLNVIVTSSTQSIQHYLDLLTSVVAAVPQIVLECQPKFREVFDYLAMLTVDTAEGLLRAVLPLMKVSLALKDSLILVLRKAMFAKQTESRKISVTGFLLILKHFQIPSDAGAYSLCSQLAYSQTFSCSQVQVSSQGRYNSAANESFCLEIIGSLRRSLTQNGGVRLHLYEGIYEVVCKNPQLTHSVLDLLFTQFKRYFEEGEDMMPPMKLNQCISAAGEQIYLVEPLAHLLCALQLCTKKSGKRLDRDDEEDEALSHLLDDIEDAITSLTKRMIKADMEDFELDKSADFSLTTSVGMKNSIFAQLVSGVYEVLMEYSFMTGKNSVESCERVLQLYEKLEKVLEVIKDKTTSGAGKKKSGASNKNSSQNLFSLKFLTAFLHAVLSNEEESDRSGLTVIRHSIELIKFAASCAVQKLNQLVDKNQCDGAGGKNADHLFRQCCILSKSFLQHINGDSLLADDVVSKDKGKKLSGICLDGLSLIIGYVSNHQPSNLKKLLENLDFTADVLTQNASTSSSGTLVFRVIRRLQRMTIKMISSPDEEMGLKEAQVLITMMKHLIPHLETNSNEYQQVYTWFYRLAAEQTIDDLALAKMIFTKLLLLHHQSNSSLSVLKKLSQDLHHQMGDIDEDVEVENHNNFSMVTEKTAAPMLFILISTRLEKILDEVDWALGKLKSIAKPPNKVTDIEDNPRETNEKLENSVCQAMTGVIMSIFELVQSAFPPGICADVVTKLLTKLYTILASLTKYYLQLYNQKSGDLIPRFEKLVKLSGTHLSQQVYAMITYMQATQSQALQDQSVLDKSRGKEKKKTNISGKNRAMKESRSIPNLIYSIEQYERYLILLSKRSKIDLMENMKRSTSRDFRINAASLEAALQELSDEEGADESSVHENSRTRNDGDVSGTGASNEGDAPVVLDLTNGDEPSITSSKKTKRDGFALPKPAKRTKLSSSSQRKPLSSLQK